MPRPDEKPPSASWIAVRVAFGDRGSLGPGKARLMELIAEKGSIAAAGKALGMSYKRAWSLAESLNSSFKGPLIAVQHGGAKGGGAVLTDLGREIVGHFRAIEEAAAIAARADLDALSRLLAEPLDRQ